MEQDFQQKYPKMIYDKDHKTKSFDIHNFDEKEVAQFYNLFGFVVFDNVLDEEQVEKSIDELWKDVTTHYNGSVDRDDPTSWQFNGGLDFYGFVGNQPLSSPQIWKNRCNPKVYKAFKKLYEISSGKNIQEALWAMFDRGSILRPTKNKPNWKTDPIYHFDMNPWLWTEVLPSKKEEWFQPKYYTFDKFKKWLGQGNDQPNIGFTKLAGVLALSQTNEESGGFECVGGFQNHIKQWCLKNQYWTDITQDAELLKNFQKIFQRKGSLLVFSRQLPHNIYQNQSQNFRYAQYVRMSPESTFLFTEEEKQKRKQCVKKMLPQYVDLKDGICKEIYMLE